MWKSKQCRNGDRCCHKHCRFLHPSEEEELKDILTVIAPKARILREEKNYYQLANVLRQNICHSCIDDAETNSFAWDWRHQFNAVIHMNDHRNSNSKWCSDNPGHVAYVLKWKEAEAKGEYDKELRKQVDAAMGYFEWRVEESQFKYQALLD